MMHDLPISSRVTSLALGQSYDCPSASDVTLEDMGKTDRYHTTTDDPCAYFTGYTVAGVRMVQSQATGATCLLYKVSYG